MKALTILLISLFYISGHSQQQLADVTYVGSKYDISKNKNFVNKSMYFIKDLDTITLNIKLPYESNTNNIKDSGIYYYCQLEAGNVYTIFYNPICIEEIPKNTITYYHSNACFKISKKCSSFKELISDSSAIPQGNYSKYFDMNNILYEITSINPDEECNYPH